MVRYSFTWAPFAILVATLVVLTSPFLALIALMLVFGAALAALVWLAWQIAHVPWTIGRAITRYRQGRSAASPQVAAPLPLAGRQHA